MTALTKTLTKGALGTVAVGAMALATATPAMADHTRHRDRGIDAGDVIAGAVIIGGIAAIAGAFDNDRDDRYRDRRYRHNRYGDRRYGERYGYEGRGRQAIERCISAAENQAQRWGGYRYANVTEIRDVDRTRYGLRISGRIEVEGNSYRRRNSYDTGRFTCYVDRGRPEVQFDGIRRLR